MAGTIRAVGPTVLLAASLILPLAAPLGAQDASTLVGDWLGTLDAGGQQLRLLVHLSAADDGTVSGTMDSIDQGANGIPITEATLVDGTVSLAVPAVGGGFEGQLSEDGESIVGTWTQGPNQLPLTITRTDEEPEAPSRPQEPTEPLPYRAEDVTFPNADAGIDLAGTLTLPEGEGPFPAVVLVSGSGPQDRDETVFGHRPFLVLADHLTRQGIAVLRYDDRGVGESTGDFGSATSADFADDAEAGVTFLASRPNVDTERIGVVGHSEGGLIAPLVANGSDDVAFIALLAGPGITGEEILYLQAELIATAGGTPRRLVDLNRTAQSELFAIMKTTEDDAEAREEMTRVFQRFFAEATDDELAALGVVGDRDEYAQNQITQLLTPWFRFFITYDPVPTLQAVDVPVLAINGEKDLQVPPRENLVAIEDALAEGGNQRVTVVELPGLNHLFQTSRTGAPTEYMSIEETMSPAALELISSWILETGTR